MDRLKFAVPVLCSMVLAAHFLREQNPFFALISVLSIPLLLVRTRWIVRGMQVFYVLASIEWVYTTIVLAAERKAMGLPWTRMAIILITVTVLTLASAWIVHGRHTTWFETNAFRATKELS